MITSTTKTTPQAALDNEISRWQPATWEDYLVYRDAPNTERVRLFFNDNYLFVQMGTEGINHAKVSDLFAILLYIWFSRYSEKKAESLGRCLIEKPKIRAAAADLVLYIGEGAPQWQAGEPRYIHLDKWRVPDLVGEISDTTLATDLDEKKQLYAALGIPEYWVIDVRGKRVIAFRLQADGKYQECTESGVLEKLAISLLEETLQHLTTETNISAASWFAQAIAEIK
ncbi:MAG: Uma2 family endonuclease [Cyanosarcina radialis HA8281-LM2]|jgi:Uma2 family endonuclease|nr:Uma2 family endonuclease [Cyanosarcina radialis HA8281-LM2]